MSKRTKPRLGRGLSGLIEAPVVVDASHLPNIYPSPVSTTISVDPVADSAGGAAVGSSDPVAEGSGAEDRLAQVDIARIRPNPFQPRQSFDDAALGRLADSIRTTGLIQPVTVRRVPDEPGRFELIAGERRWRAAQLAGLTHLAAMVIEASDRQVAESALIENLQREDLDPIERAGAFRGLIERFGLSQNEIAQRVGLDRSTVANMLRLLDLEAEIKALVRDGRLSPGHAKAILASPAGPNRVKLAQRVASEGWTVRRVEQAVRAAARKGRSSAAAAPEAVELGRMEASISELERQLGEHLATRVRIIANATGTKGRITIEFYGLDQFEGLMGRIGFQMRS